MTTTSRALRDLYGVEVSHAIHHWRPALDEFQIVFGEDRVPLVAV